MAVDAGKTFEADRFAPTLDTEALTTELGQVRCIVCGASATIRQLLPKWGSWCRCTNCGLEFADPQRLPEDPTVIFNRAYRGEEQGCGMQEFAYRASIRHALLSDPKLWFFNPAAIDEILGFLKRKVPPGGTVFEIGCGLGLFLRVLKHEGFNPIGLDVAKVVVDMNRKEGFEVWHGTLDSVPPDLTKPDAIVSLFVLHHLEDPMGFFTSLRRLWPQAVVAIAEYGQTESTAAAAGYPPRTLHRWNATALATAMGHAGYVTTPIEINSSGTEHPALRPIRAMMRRTIIMPRIFRMLKAVQRRVLPKVLKSLQQRAYTVVGFGEPPETPAQPFN